MILLVTSAMDMNCMQHIKKVPASRKSASQSSQLDWLSGPIHSDPCGICGQHQPPHPPHCKRPHPRKRWDGAAWIGVGGLCQIRVCLPYPPSPWHMNLWVWPIAAVWLRADEILDVFKQNFCAPPTNNNHCDPWEQVAHPFIWTEVAHPFVRRNAVAPSLQETCS